MKGLERLQEYYKAKDEAEETKREEINAFNEQLRENPVGTTDKLIKQIEAVKAEAQNLPVLDAEAGSEAHNKLRGTIVTKEMQVLREHAVNLNKQLRNLQDEAVQTYTRNVARASYNMVAHDEYVNAKNLHNETVKAMKALSPYLVAKDTF